MFLSKLFSKNSEKYNLFEFSKSNHHSFFQSSPPSANNSKIASELEEKCYKKIIELNFNKEEEEKNKKKILHFYVKNNDLKSLELFFQNSKSSTFEILKENLDENCSNCSFIHTAAKFGRIEILKLFFEKICKNEEEIGKSINFVDGINSTPLFYAIANNLFDTVNYFLSLPRIDVNVFDVFNNSALFLSFNPKKEFQISEQQKILEKKYLYKFKIFNIPNLLILKGFNLNLEDSNKDTVINLILKSNDKNKIEKVRFLLASNKIDFKRKNKDGNNFLYFAIGQPDILSLLIEKMFIKTNSNDWFNDKLSQKEGIFTSKNLKSENLFHRCVEVGCIQSLMIISKLFVDKKEFEREINWKNNLAQTPLHYSILFRQFSLLQFLISFKEINVDIPDLNGNTPLNFCLIKLKDAPNLSNIISLLINIGNANRKVKNYDDVTPEKLISDLKIKIDKKKPSISELLNKNINLINEIKIKNKSDFFNEKVERTWAYNKKLIEIISTEKKIKKESDKISKRSNSSKREQIDEEDLVSQVLTNSDFDLDEEMELMESFDNFQLGIPLIDFEHEVMFEFTNYLYNNIILKREYWSLGFVLASAEKFFVTHFKDEENAMKDFDYEVVHVEKHSKHHSMAVEFVQKLIKDFLDEKPGVDSELFDYLINIANSHVLDDDKLLADSILNKCKNNSFSKLKEIEEEKKIEKKEKVNQQKIEGEKENEIPSQIDSKKNPKEFDTNEIISDFTFNQLLSATTNNGLWHLFFQHQDFNIYTSNIAFSKNNQPIKSFLETYSVNEKLEKVVPKCVNSEMQLKIDKKLKKYKPLKFFQTEKKNEYSFIACYYNYKFNAVFKDIQFINLESLRCNDTETEIYWIQKGVESQKSEKFKAYIEKNFSNGIFNNFTIFKKVSENQTKIMRLTNIDLIKWYPDSVFSKIVKKRCKNFNKGLKNDIVKNKTMISLRDDLNHLLKTLEEYKSKNSIVSVKKIDSPGSSQRNSLRNSIDLQSILDDNDLKSLFLDFLKLRHNEEQLLFLFDVIEYKSMKSIDDKIKKANNIMFKYLKEGSEFQLNFSKDFYENIEKGYLKMNDEKVENQELFTDIEKKTRAQITLESLPQFFQSENFGDFSETLKKNKLSASNLDIKINSKKSSTSSNLKESKSSTEIKRYSVVEKESEKEIEKLKDKRVMGSFDVSILNSGKSPIDSLKSEEQTIFDFNEKKNLESLKNEDIVKFLEKNNLKNYAPMFAKYNIVGKDLIQMDKKDLRDIGVKDFKDRKKLLELIEMQKEVVMFEKSDSLNLDDVLRLKSYQVDILIEKEKVKFEKKLKLLEFIKNQLK